MTRMLVLLLLASAVEAGADAGRHAPELVTDKALVRADEFGADWLMYSRNYSGHRFSPLDQVDTGNVDDLVPQWAFSLGALGAQESTPVVHRGVMYVTSNAAALHAIAADTGELLWSFDSEPPEDVDDFTSTSVNRGAAIWSAATRHCAGRCSVRLRRSVPNSWVGADAFFGWGSTRWHTRCSCRCRTPL